MDTVDVVLGRVIAQQPQVQQVSRARQKFEWREISLVKRRSVRPDPADTILFQQPDELRPMPAGMTKFNGKPEIPRQLREELAQCVFANARRKRWRELNKDYLELRPK